MKCPIVLLSLLFTAAPLAAQEKAEEENANTEKEEVQVAQAEPDKKETKSKKETEKDADDYRPTEEISEDLSVSYPIDI